MTATTHVLRIRKESFLIGGKVRHLWTLSDGEGRYLTIGHHGGVAPTRQAARDEAERRIAAETTIDGRERGNQR